MKSLNLVGSALLLGLAVVAGGCRAVAPPDSPSAPWTPPDWAGEEAARDPEAISLRPAADLSAPLTLAECADIALANNPATRRAWAAARAAAAGLGQAASLRYPRLTVSGEGTYQRQKYNLREEAPGLDADVDGFVYGPALELTYLLFDFGGVSGGIEEARQGLLAANYSFNRSIQDLLLEVGTAYYGLNSARSGLSAAEADVEDARTADQAAREKYQVGLVSKLDELQARSSYQDSLYRLETARGELETARAGLARALGFSPGPDFEIADPGEGIPSELSETDVAELIERGLRLRPDIAALRAGLRGREAALRAARSSLYPSLNLGGSANQLWYEYNSGPELYDDSYSYSGYLALKWDIFTGFSDRARARQAEAEREAAREDLAAAELDAAADVWNRYYAYNTAVRKYQFSRAYLETSRESYNLARDSYDNGLKSILDLLQSQSDLSTARSQLISAERDVFVALAELTYSTGTLTREGLAGAE
ncbi:MAG: TolC family protein [Candidatus Erginobacter occultus]|nr:TolC family protein [Candidatus Erginobacter occultus]